jgi:hypothetical protein
MHADTHQGTSNNDIQMNPHTTTTVHIGTPSSEHKASASRAPSDAPAKESGGKHGHENQEEGQQPEKKPKNNANDDLPLHERVPLEVTKATEWMFDKVDPSRIEKRKAKGLPCPYDEDDDGQMPVHERVPYELNKAGVWFFER